MEGENYCRVSFKLPESIYEKFWEKEKAYFDKGYLGEVSSINLREEGNYHMIDYFYSDKTEEEILLVLQEYVESDYLEGENEIDEVTGIDEVKETGEDKRTRCVVC